MKMYGRKGGWGRESLMAQGEKERLKVTLRLKVYGTNLPYVDAFLSINGKELALNDMRKIQNDCCREFKLTTDRAAWRTKVGMKAWFCEYWNIIRGFVFEKVALMANSGNYGKSPPPSNLQPATNDLNFKTRKNYIFNQQMEISLHQNYQIEEQKKEPFIQLQHYDEPESPSSSGSCSYSSSAENYIKESNNSMSSSCTNSNISSSLENDFHERAVNSFYFMSIDFLLNGKESTPPPSVSAY